MFHYELVYDKHVKYMIDIEITFLPFTHLKYHCIIHAVQVQVVVSTRVAKISFPRNFRNLRFSANRNSDGTEKVEDENSRCKVERKLIQYSKECHAIKEPVGCYGCSRGYIRIPTVRYSRV